MRHVQWCIYLAVATAILVYMLILVEYSCSDVVFLFYIYSSVEGFICGKEVNHIVKQRNHTLNGTDYNCTMNRTLKQTECVPSCVHQNQTVQCNVKTHINRRKGYTCVPHPGQDSSLEMKINFPEVVTSNCQCHYYTTL